MSKAAPRSALVTPNWSMPHQPLLTPFDAPGLVNNAYGGNLYVYRATNYICNNIASLPYRAGREKHGTHRASHPLARLLGPPPGSPNPMWAPGMFWRYSIAQYLVMGKIAWAVEWDKGRIAGLWPLPAQHVRPVLVDPNSRQTSYFEGYDYGVPGNQGYRRFKPNEMIYMWRPSLTDPRQPESIVQIAAPEINIATMIREFDAAFLKNGGVPSHLVVTDGFEVDEERQAFRSQFVRQFGGAANSHKPMFAEREIEMGEDGAKVDPVQVIKVGQSQIDSQMNDLRDSKISDVTVALGVPLSLLGESRVQKYSNIQADRETAWKETIRPIFSDLEDLVNTHLAPLFDSETVGWFDAEKINELRPTPRFADEYVPALVQAGIITEDEYRADRGLPPLTDEQRKALGEAQAAAQDTGPAALPAATDKTAEPVAQVKPLKPRKKDTPAPAQPAKAAHLAVARSIADSLVTEMLTAAEKRASGRRNRPALDVPYWERRVNAMVGPAMLAAEMPEADVRTFASVLVRAVATHTERADSLPDEVRKFATGLLDGPSTVSAWDVEQALIGMATGTVERGNALRLIQGGAG